MADNCENAQKPEDVAENIVKTGSGIAETIVNAVNELNTETVIPTLADGIKSLTNDENSKETIDKVSDATKKTAGVAAKIISKIIKTGSDILTDDVIPTVSEIARGEEHKE
jgi:SMC interacting uncharacterized protein involved in chromosome segregation